MSHRYSDCDPDCELPVGLGGATSAAAAIRRGDLRASELADIVLTRLTEADAELNAIVATCPDRARQEAADVDRALSAGAPLGPLAGVPISVKEAFHTVGLPTTWGLPENEGWTADQDATVVHRLRAAGAIVVGKTNVATMLADFAQTQNKLYGRTNNPHDLTRSPGGSSGGSAAAVAAGLTFLDFGSDLAGSIRIPAAFCGVYGLRPTANIVPQDGFAPPAAPPTPLPPDIAWVSTLGPIARTPADIREALAITRTSREPQFSPSKPVRLNGLRLGVVLDDPNCAVSSDVGAVLSDALDRLAAAGVDIEQGWPLGVDPDRAMPSFGFALQRFMAAADPTSDWSATDAEIDQERQTLGELRAAWTRYFTRVDAFLCPVNFTAAIEHDDRPFDERTVHTVDGERRYDEQPFWTAQPAVAGLPALAAPAGRTSAGLPVGVQIVGPPGGDELIIDIAELLAGVLGGYQSPGSASRPTDAEHRPGAPA
ncbi:MAG: amidase family protein [Pseudonocardiales bacterium]